MIERGDGGGVDDGLSGLERAKIAEREKLDAVNHPEHYLEDVPDSPTDQIASIAKEIDRGGMTPERAKELYGRLKDISNELSKAHSTVCGAMKVLAPIELSKDRSKAYAAMKVLVPIIRNGVVQSPETQSDEQVE